MAKEKPDEAAVTDDTPEGDSDAVLSDEDVEKLFANISEDAEQPDDSDGKNVDEEPEADSPPATLDPRLLATPEGKQAIADAVAQATAAKQTKDEQETQRQELQTLIDDNNVEELGKRWLESQRTQKSGQAAVDGFLESFYRGLFSDPLFQSLTPEERKEIEPDETKFSSDAAYVKHLTQWMANKISSGLTDEDLEERLKERIEAMRSGEKGEKVRAGSVAGGAPADGGAPARPTDSRTLIQEGLRESFSEHYETQE